MRQDSILRWLVDARNRIEKQGDLETKSRLHVSFSESWYDGPKIEEDLPVSFSPERIIDLIGPRLPPEARTEAALLRVERAWIDSELPNVEILQALVHCYLKLLDVINEAHTTFAVPGCDFPKRAAISSGGLPQFMLDADKPRIAWLKMKEQSTASVATEMVRINRDQAEDAGKHYGFNKSYELIKSTNFRDRCVGYFEMAKRVLEVDGFHIPTILLEGAAGPQIFQLKMADRAEKHIVIRDMARKAMATRATAVMLINEAWVAPVSFGATGKYPIDCPERTEALLLNGLTKTGETVNHFCRFTRVNSKVQLGSESCDTTEIPNILEPFLSAWNLARSR